MTNSRLLSQSREVSQAKLSRRSLLKSAALGSAATLAAPYVRGAYAAGSLSLGGWDHWVPGANNALIKLCNEWGEKNNVDVHIDFITSVGDKDLLTASAEAQAGAGHDMMSHRAWQIQVHRDVLEPVGDIVDALIKDYGPISPVAEYLAQHDKVWYGLPTTVGSQVKPPASRIDLYKQHCGIDLTKMFPVGGHRATRRCSTAGTTISTSRPLSSCSKPAIPSVWRWDRPATRSMRPARSSAPSVR